MAADMLYLRSKYICAGKFLQFFKLMKWKDQKEITLPFVEKVTKCLLSFYIRCPFFCFGWRTCEFLMTFILHKAAGSKNEWHLILTWPSYFLSYPIFFYWVWVLKSLYYFKCHICLVLWFLYLYCWISLSLGFFNR